MITHEQCIRIVKMLQGDLMVPTVTMSVIQRLQACNMRKTTDSCWAVAQSWLHGKRDGYRGRLSRPKAWMRKHLTKQDRLELKQAGRALQVCVKFVQPLSRPGHVMLISCPV